MQTFKTSYKIAYFKISAIISRSHLCLKTCETSFIFSQKFVIRIKYLLKPDLVFTGFKARLIYYLNKV